MVRPAEIRLITDEMETESFNGKKVLLKGSCYPALITKTEDGITAVVIWQEMSTGTCYVPEEHYEEVGEYRLHLAGLDKVEADDVVDIKLPLPVLEKARVSVRDLVGQDIESITFFKEKE